MKIKKYTIEEKIPDGAVFMFKENGPGNLVTDNNSTGGYYTTVTYFYFLVEEEKEGIKLPTVKAMGVAQYIHSFLRQRNIMLSVQECDVLAEEIRKI